MNHTADTFAAENPRTADESDQSYLIRYTNWLRSRNELRAVGELELMHLAGETMIEANGYHIRAGWANEQLCDRLRDHGKALQAVGQGSNVPPTIMPAIEKERAAMRETNSRLNRRTQQAEAALRDFTRIMALPTDERGIRFVTGSFGRALLAWQSHKLQERVELLETALRIGRAWGMNGRGYSARLAIALNAWVDAGMKDALPELEEYERKYVVENQDKRN